MKVLFLKLCRALGLFRLAQRINREKLCILCYHGFGLELDTAFEGKLFIQCKTFASRLEYLKQSGRPVLPLDEAVRRLYEGTLPHNAVAITIDDGFYSTLLAGQHLQRYGFPATVYVTTYYVQKKTPVYELFVQYAFATTSVSRLREGAVIHGFDRVVDLSNKQAREKACERFVEYGSKCSIEQQVDIANRLGKALRVSYEPVRESRKLSLLTLDEIATLRQYGLDVQLHTHRHRLPADRQSVLREVGENRNALAPVSSSALEHFCYPSGVWSSAHWPWLSEAGIRTATTCDYGLNTPHTDNLALRRFLDGDHVSQIEFEAAVSGFAEWLKAVKQIVVSLRRWIEPAPVRNLEIGAGAGK